MEEKLKELKSKRNVNWKLKEIDGWAREIVKLSSYPLSVRTERRSRFMKEESKL